ncbi:RNA methyltransferase, partial [Burkholderia pseudomallei]
CVVTDGALAHEEARGIGARIEPARVVTLPDVLFGQLSNVVNGVGLLLLVARPAPALPARVAGPSVVLDRVQDAGNLGSNRRSAAA